MPADINKSASDAIAGRREGRWIRRTRQATNAASADGTTRPNQALGAPGMT